MMHTALRGRTGPQQGGKRGVAPPGHPAYAPAHQAPCREKEGKGDYKWQELKDKS
jgi:hypothetical protein